MRQRCCQKNTTHQRDSPTKLVGEEGDQWCTKSETKIDEPIPSEVQKIIQATTKSHKPDHDPAISLS
ncbi:hypothetical protein MKW98_027079 [Papaver atlanticum]|uniref:Uncharacterized protein n=1 Tax=Papaver atlanticum TaxID=357466 RepID=A0AAD4S9D3_9MAGN|nr:hypothetical protein MKW98_027079 [Papaver atlanticum]